MPEPMFTVGSGLIESEKRNQVFWRSHSRNNPPLTNQPNQQLVLPSGKDRATGCGRDLQNKVRVRSSFERDAAGNRLFLSQKSFSSAEELLTI